MRAATRRRGATAQPFGRSERERQQVSAGHAVASAPPRLRANNLLPMQAAQSRWAGYMPRGALAGASAQAAAISIRPAATASASLAALAGAIP